MPLDKGVTGYIENSAIDWAGLTNGLSDTIYDVGEKREIRKQELDDQWTDMNTQLASAEVPANQTLGDIFLNTTNAGTSKALEWNKQLKAGKISPDQYTKLMNNLKQNFEGFVNTAATFDKRYKEYMDRQETGKASALELEFASKFGKMAELNGKSSIIDLDGNIKLANIDPATGKVTDLYDMRTMNKPENIIDNKVILGDEVETYTKSWESTELWTELGRNGWKSIDTARQTPGYNMARDNVIEALVNPANPRKVLSILADNGGIQLNGNTYTTAEEKARLVQAAKDKLIEQKKRIGESPVLSDKELKQIDLNMVEMVKSPSNVFQPKLTKEQLELAKELVGRAVDVSVGQKMEGAARSYYKPDSGGGSGNGANEKVPNTDLYETLQSAYVNPKDPQAKINTIAMAERLTNATAGKYTFYAKKGVPGYFVYETSREKNFVDIKKERDEIAKHLPTSRDALAYLFGPGVKGANDYDTQRMLSEQGKPANPIYPTYSNPKKKTKGFNAAQEANIRATMKANPGATRAQAIQSLGY